MNATSPVRRARGPHRTTARIVGIVYLAGIAVYLTGNLLVQSILAESDHLSAHPAKSMILAGAAMLMLLASVGDAVHGVLMYPILKRDSERLALGYFAARIVDAVLIAIGVVLILVQVPLSREYVAAGAADTTYLRALSDISVKAHLYAYELGMIAVGFAGLMLCIALARAKLLPRGLALWGLVGYASLLCGSALQVLGLELHLAHTIVGGLWELFMGVWLIAKGFSSSESEELVGEPVPEVAASPA